MARTVDVRSSGGEFVVLGGALVLPTSANAVSSNSNGSLRYNSSTKVLELYVDGVWSNVTGALTYSDLPSSAKNALAQVSIPGIIPANQECMIMPIVMNMQIPANFASSAGYAVTQAAAPAAFTVSYIRSGVTTPIGTITFVSGNSAPNFSTQAAVNLVPGDTIVIFAPSPADAQLANVGITLFMTKQ